MLRYLLRPFGLVLVVTAATALSGCGYTMPEMNFFPNRGQLFKSQDWATASKTSSPDVLARGPVSPEEQIDAAGQCVAQAPATPTDAAVGTIAGDLGTTAAPPQAAPTLLPGAVTLGMTECQVVAHAGQPGQVNIAADEKNERKVVLTYLNGPWPGIYTFSAGRLKVIDRVAQPEPPKPVKKKGRAPRAAATGAQQR